MMSSKGPASPTKSSAELLFLCRHPNPDALYRLFVFPAAGLSGGNYSHLGAAEGVSLSPDTPERLLEVHVLNINYRGCKTVYRDIAALGSDIAAYITTLHERSPAGPLPYVLFGHSFGSLLVFHFISGPAAATLDPPPVGGLVTARPPPHRGYAPGDAFSQMTRSKQIERLRAMGATPEPVLADPAIMDLVLPLLCATFDMNDTYRDVLEKAGMDLPPSDGLAGTKQYSGRGSCADRGVVALRASRDFDGVLRSFGGWACWKGVVVRDVDGDHFWPLTREGGHTVLRAAVDILE
eukprot:TRINITY_DN1603_c0_g1_i1.p1 TRINITY_DN1603_c0_g1~~TRINITY_DN1603_c0_g1_i1.p1  ORF type:complete len:294 (-),score=48.89 TRINITY_DN1603_c0_g1_i1:266-1147(-)